MPVELLDVFSQFGAAGLIGLLWITERAMARRRDRELSEAHDRIIRDDEMIQMLMRLVKQNTHAIEQFASVQRHLTATLARLDEHVRSKAA